MALADLFGWRETLTAMAMVAVGLAKDWPLPWIILGACTAFVLVAAGRWFWKRGNLPSLPAAPVATPSAGVPELMPIVDFLRAAERRGWHFAGRNSQVLDFLGILREDAANGRPRFYGVQVKTGTQEELRGPRIQIPSEHWQEFQVEYGPCFRLDPHNGEIVAIRHKNTQTRSYTLTHETGFVDLHVVADDAATWIEHSLVPLEEAARTAYDQTRGTAVARAAEESSSADGAVLTWYGHALWQRLPIFGVWPPATSHEEIPRDQRNVYIMELDAGRIVLRESYGKGRYERIMVRGSDLPTALRSIREIAG
jgi:hypothetical protein